MIKEDSARISISGSSFGQLFSKQGWRTPRVEKLATSEDSKTNVRDEFPFYDSDGWGMYELRVRTTLLIPFKVFYYSVSRQFNLFTLHNPFLETFYIPKIRND